MRASIIVITIVSTLILNSSCSVIVNRRLRPTLEDLCNRLHVEITVNSEVDKVNIPRALEISWWNAEALQGDWVGILTSQPSQELDRSAAAWSSLVPLGENNGWTTTTLSANDLPPLDTSNFNRQCLRYWAVYVNSNNSVMAYECLGTHPQWMKQIKDIISKIRLKELFIPGTHDSGSFKINSLGRISDLVKKYSLTQEDSFIVQLLYGTRYLDVRPSKYPLTTETWWINHGIIRMQPLLPLLNQVRAFLNATEEIVILDMHEFPVGFSTGIQTHEEFANFLISEFGDLMVPKTYGWYSTLGDIWKSGKRLIVAYNQADIAATSDYFWTGVDQQWGNVQKVEDLYSYVNQTMRKSFSRSWAVMAELTANSWNIILDDLGGLRKMAQMVNKNVTLWFRGNWGNTVNIVATDFYRGTGIVEAAIEMNILKGNNVNCKKVNKRLPPRL